jgi:hypothetical protein
MSPDQADVIVIGAGSIHLRKRALASSKEGWFKTALGISGIAAARFYLEIHPDCQLVILEKDSTPGGTWNSGKNPTKCGARMEGIPANGKPLTTAWDRERIWVVLDTDTAGSGRIFRHAYASSTSGRYLPRIFQSEACHPVSGKLHWSASLWRSHLAWKDHVWLRGAKNSQAWKIMGNLRWRW